MLAAPSARRGFYFAAVALCNWASASGTLGASLSVRIAGVLQLKFELGGGDSSVANAHDLIVLSASLSSSWHAAASLASGPSPHSSSA